MGNFFSRFRRSIFPEWVREGGAGGFLFSVAALLIYMPAGGRASAGDIFSFDAPAVQFPWSGGRGFWWLSSLGVEAFDIDTKGERAAAVYGATVFACVYSYACRSRVIETWSYS